MQTKINLFSPASILMQLAYYLLTYYLLLQIFVLIKYLRTDVALVPYDKNVSFFVKYVFLHFFKNKF